MNLSIITINKNNAQGLEKTCLSVVSQTYTDFEWIVIDGASDDNSIEIIKKYTDKMSYWISEPDSGIYNAMNKGIRQSKGQFCLFLNSGDWLVSSTTLTDVFKEINEDNISEIFYSDKINSNGTINKYTKMLNVNSLLDSPINHQNSLIKRKLFIEHGLYNEDFKISSDWEYFLTEIVKYNTKFTYLNTNISIFEIDGIGGIKSLDKYNEKITMYQNVFGVLSDIMLEYSKYHKSTYKNIVYLFGINKIFIFILRSYKYSMIILYKLLNIFKIIFNKTIYKLFYYIKIPIIFLLEIFTTSNNILRLRFSNFRNIPYDFFLIPINIFCNNKQIKYKLTKYYSPHIHFFSVFGNKNDILKQTSAKKIFFTGENINNASVNKFYKYKGNCIDNVSLSLGFDYLDYDNYIRLPLWILYYFNPNNSKDEIKTILNNFNKPYNKTKFCALIASHDRSGIRKNIYNDLSIISHIDCPGRFLHNDDSLQNVYKNEKSLYLQQYKFNICPENSISPGYVTEKLFQSLFSGCIPIYNGWNKDPEPDIINPDIILWYENSNSTPLIKEIKNLYTSDKLFQAFIKKPIFCKNAVDKIFTYLQLYSNKIQDIAKMSISNAS